MVGFDTYLELDDAVALDWRKYASALPRLLFRHDQYVVGTVEHRAFPEPRAKLAFETTVSDALDNMASAGLGWSATVAAYAEFYRPDGVAAGMNSAQLRLERLSDAEKLRQIEQFRKSPPADDLMNLGRTMAHQWQHPDAEGVTLLNDLNYDGRIRQAIEAAFATYDAATIAGVSNPSAAARAAENIAVLDRQAPLLAWPMIICVLLKHLPANTRIAFNLSEEAWEYADEDGFDLAEYAAEWWESASSELAKSAQMMGRMFAVLSSFDGELGREYWFARAIEFLAQTESSSSSLTGKMKGDRLEDLVEAILRTEEPELAVLEKNYRTPAEEIDVLLTNSLKDPFWIAHGSPLILVECKNTTEKVGIEDLRIFESKIRDRGERCKVGIFVSTSGFTKPFMNRLPTFQANGGVIFRIDGQELREIVEKKIRLTDWLRLHRV